MVRLKKGPGNIQSGLESKGRMEEPYAVHAHKSAYIILIQTRMPLNHTILGIIFNIIWIVGIPGSRGQDENCLKLGSLNYSPTFREAWLFILLLYYFIQQYPCHEGISLTRKSRVTIPRLFVFAQVNSRCSARHVSNRRLGLSGKEGQGQRQSKSSHKWNSLHTCYRCNHRYTNTTTLIPEYSGTTLSFRILRIATC